MEATNSVLHKLSHTPYAESNFELGKPLQGSTVVGPSSSSKSAQRRYKGRRLQIRQIAQQPMKRKWKCRLLKELYYRGALLQISLIGVSLINVHIRK